MECSSMVGIATFGSRDHVQILAGSMPQIQIKNWVIYTWIMQATPIVITVALSNLEGGDK